MGLFAFYFYSVLWNPVDPLGHQQESTGPAGAQKANTGARSAGFMNLL
jgi:hypothetical protein